MLAGLDPEQRAVATALHGPVCVLAGAGTGKTRAITHRIAYGVRSGVYQPAQVLAVTFTARAAGEMRGRLRQLGADGVQARTFHAAALRQLQYFWPRAVGGPTPQLLERKVQLVAEAAGRCGLRVQRTELRDLTAEIEWAKVTQTGPDDYPAAVAKSGRDAPRDPAETAQVYRVYEETKSRRGNIDFEDVLLLTAAILEDRPDIADQVRAQYRHFTVDEYQDVSPLQQRLLDQWTGPGGGASLCVVGDASQTIYSFTGATPDYLLNFRSRHPEATVVKLVRDYRSTPQVVHLANGLLAQARGEAARHRLELVSQRETGPEPVYTEYDDEPTEAETTARRIKDLLATGVRASEIAVLFRTNGQSEVYEQALADLGVPYQLKGAERFFERPEVRDAGVLLRGAARAADDPLTAGAPDLAGQVRAVLATRGFTPEPPAGSGAVRDRWESLAALVRLAEEFERTCTAEGRRADLAAYVTELDARAAAQHAPAVEGVTLASLHAAKGLEWDAVYLVGLTEGTLPIIYAKTDEQIEEERRLLYVGVTRARKHLSLSWALSRSPGGRASRKPSRFLDGLRPGSAAPGARTGGRGGRGSVEPGERSAARRVRGPVKCRVCDRVLTEAVERKLRRCEDCPSTMDEGLYERLREWRARQAKKQGAPAYVVFTDATLMAIAEDVPAGRQELALISGVGAMKLDKYGAAVLSLCAGEEPEEEPEAVEDGEPADSA
ncbi:ATP-dependent helicase [Streptomyces rubellomurinus]|uniref:DNA 3'-5' helicase n=2 Tax=Streptomyces TaxID=1883 RepID=A0A0F2T6S4_STRR3|nr:ATP-dependent helicase [Streptomyces rubellomurinus]KJS54164.1 ATP-dependent DNA helicase [Streptomyces rubellomurinus subsp. indigoferus]KJS58015.1 ATP-dependent DNA helicase [Streptomyces rubellomurinus]